MSRAPANVLSYIPTAQHPAIFAGTSVYDATADIQLALTQNVGRALYFPSGKYLITSVLSIQSGTSVYGDGPSTRIVSNTTMPVAGGGLAGGQHALFKAFQASGWSISDMTLDISPMTSWTVSNGVRCILAYECQRYSVERCRMITSGASVASVGSSRYKINDNIVEIASTDGQPHGDGMIDQWSGSSDFEIRRNRLYGNNIGRYAILVTGLGADLVTPTPCAHFDISENTIYNSNVCGVWAMGRNGGVFDFSIHNNDIADVVPGDGIVISDAQRFLVTNNRIRNIGARGVRLFRETTELNTGAGCFDGRVCANSLFDCNVNGGVTNNDGSAIVIMNESERNVIAENMVRGSAHRYACWIDSPATLNSVRDTAFTAGSQGTSAQGGAGNTIAS